MAENETLVERIRNEAAQSSRAGQMERLEAIANEVDRLKRGAVTLGQTIESQGRMILDVTGLHHVIGEDGDGDWGYVWESAYEMLPKVEAAKAMRSKVAEALDDPRWRDDADGDWLERALWAAIATGDAQ